jgi:methionyl-tRNA formyltransferase
MKIVFITGDHLRHEYLVSCFSKYFKNVLWIKQKRKKIDEVEKYKIDHILNKIYKKHLNLLKKSEKKYFKIKKTLNNINVINITENQINSKYVKQKINFFKPNCLISYGCKKFNDNFLKLRIKHMFNVHGGLSPWYRGVITNFWPTYLLEPQFTGMTLHFISNKIDGGDVLFQTSINPKEEDGIQDNHCNAVINFCKIIPKKLSKVLNSKKKILGIKQISSGRIWTKSMWNPHHLNLVYKTFNNKINKYCKSKNINVLRKPKLLNIC